MYLDEFDIPSALKPNSTSYKVFYNYRVNQLLEYLMQLFTWNGLPNSIPNHIIDLYLYLYGKCGINYNKDDKENSLIACVIYENGITDYFDTFNKYTWSTPKHHGQQYKDLNGIIIKNTLLHNSAYPLIHTTAAKLAHADCTYICTNVNGRSTSAIKAISNKYANDAREYQRQQYNGIPSFIVDKGFSTIEVEDLHTQNNMNVREIIDTQQLILAEFWETLGVLKMSEKRERMTAAETTPNQNLLHLNIKNMYDRRKEGAAAINKMFGTHITVKCNVDIDEDPNTNNDQFPEADPEPDQEGENNNDN